MNSKIKKMIALMLCLTLAIGVVGCGTPEETKTESEATQTEAEATESETSDEGITKKELTIAMPNDVTSLDPMQNWQTASYYFYWTIYERLIKYDVETGEYVPELAKSWDLSDDGTVYTFNLQEDVKWHDGSDFTANDVKYTIERGIELGTGNYPGVDYVEVVDDLTAKVHLLAPDSVFMDKQWTGDCCVLKEGSGDQLGQHPIGTGPFKFVEWSSGDYIVIEENDDYWGETSGTEKITFKIIPEASIRLISLQSGDVDIAPIDATGIDQAKADENIELLETPSITIIYLAFNTANENFTNKLVRQAIGYAIDKEAIVEAQLEGEGSILKSVVGFGKMGFYDEFEGYDYDPEKAKELLAEAGYADGFDTELSIRDNEIAAQLIQANLADVGINVSIDKMDPATMSEQMQKGNYEMSLQYRSGGSADSYLSFYHSKDFGPGGNNMFYKNDELDALLDASHLELDMEKRNVIYKEIQEHISEFAPTHPLFAGTIFLGTNKNIQNVRPDVEGCHDYRNVYYGG